MFGAYGTTQIYWRYIGNISEKYIGYKSNGRYILTAPQLELLAVELIFYMIEVSYDQNHPVYQTQQLLPLFILFVTVFCACCLYLSRKDRNIVLQSGDRFSRQ